MLISRSETVPFAKEAYTSYFDDGFDVCGLVELHCTFLIVVFINTKIRLL